MRGPGVGKVVRVVLCVVAGAAVFGFIVKSLWNVLVPPIFGWHTIGFWQALGLLILSKILFGGFHRHAGRGRERWGERFKQRMDAMTPEERERFRKGMRCGRGGFPPAAEPLS